MELSDYELIRYPSGQVVITRVASDAPSSGPRDVVGAYSNEQEAQRALQRLAGDGRQRPADSHASSTALSG